MKDYTDKMFMRKQDPPHPKYRYSSGEEYCDHISSPKDGAAGTEFMRAELREMTHYGATPEVSDKLKKTIAERESSEGNRK